MASVVPSSTYQPAIVGEGSYGTTDTPLAALAAYRRILLFVRAFDVDVFRFRFFRRLVPGSDFEVPVITDRQT